MLHQTGAQPVRTGRPGEQRSVQHVQPQPAAERLGVVAERVEQFPQDGPQILLDTFMGTGNPRIETVPARLELVVAGHLQRLAGVEGRTLAQQLARQALRERRLDEAYQDWLRQLRDRTYVENRLEEK